jgi:diaminopimelate epimerase
MSAVEMVIPFTKASACGNDFLIIEGTHVPFQLATLTQQICDRHNGVGADGVEWLFPAGDADVEARLINADGSAAEISGNGTRCVAAYLCVENQKESVVIRTGAGLKTCTLAGRSGNTFEFETEMGIPQLGGEFAVRTSFGEVKGTSVSMGNPHFVVFVAGFWPDWQLRAAEIQRDKIFKNGINIELVVIKDRQRIDVCFFERGVGETQSSGTGSCAAAVAAITNGRADSPLRVQAPGGAQMVRFEKEVFLQGPAQLICRGEFFI